MSERPLQSPLVFQVTLHTEQEGSQRLPLHCALFWSANSAVEIKGPNPGSTELHIDRRRQFDVAARREQSKVETAIIGLIQDRQRNRNVRKTIESMRRGETIAHAHVAFRPTGCVNGETDAVSHVYALINSGTAECTDQVIEQRGLIIPNRDARHGQVNTGSVRRRNDDVAFSRKRIKVRFGKIVGLTLCPERNTLV